MDWGLGHATRCVPIINELLQLGHHIIIGADKNPLAFLKEEFPELPTVIIPGYEIIYNEKGSFFKLFTESVRFNKYIKIEHRLIDKIIGDYNIDLIISDNRYGLWSKKVKSILITHQLFPKIPIGGLIAYKKIEQLIASFDECWIPDIEGAPNLSGDLSHLKTFKPPHRFIGPLSRFSKLCLSTPLKELGFEYDIIAIISGPEPQRTIFEELIMQQIKKYKLKAVVVRGLPSHSVIASCHSEPVEGTVKQSHSDNKIALSSQKVLPRNDGNIKIFNHLPTAELFQHIQQSKLIVCRSGYSSIMDMATLGKKALLVPTLGQTEQEYLANYHLKQGNFYSQKQSEFNLQKGLVELENYTPITYPRKPLVLDFL